MPAIGTAYVSRLEQRAPKCCRDKPRGAPAGGTGECGAPGRVCEERVRESDRVGQAYPQRSLMREIRERARDDREPDVVQPPEDREAARRHTARDKRLEQRALLPVVALVKRDDLVEHRVGRGGTGAPAFVARGE